MTLLTIPRPTRRTVTDEFLAQAAVDALVEEALLTPKPGLVDRRGSGVHNDMSLDLMLRSASALHGTFRRLAAEGRRGASAQQLRTASARIGRDGEKIMMAETGGVNTHRGAIWALGLATVAAASLQSVRVDLIAAKIATIASYQDAALRRSQTAGSLVRQRYGVGGAVDQARAGFPHAVAGVHVLRAAKNDGADKTTARLDALLTSMARLDDTCILGRGGVEALAFTQSHSARALASGGFGTEAGRRVFDRLDHGLSLRGASPGGSADMLALALFLDTLDPTDQDD